MPYKNIGSKIRNTVIQRWSDRKSPINQKLHISDFIYIYQNPTNVNLALILFFKDVSENKLLNNINTIFNKLKDNFFQNKKSYFINVSDKELNEIPEYLLKCYLIENCKKYAIKVYEDLDQTIIQKRGDLKGKWKGKEVIIEVEKTDLNFVKHNHQSKIDLVFTLPPKKTDLSIPTIYGDRGHFLSWMEEKKKIETYQDTLFFLLYEIIRRKKRLLILNPSDFFTSKKMEDCISSDLNDNHHFIDMDSKYGTPIWFTYKQHEILGNIILEGIKNKKNLQSKSIGKFIEELEEKFKVKCKLLNQGEF